MSKKSTLAENTGDAATVASLGLSLPLSQKSSIKRYAARLRGLEVGGGIIRGAGTATSDSVPAIVRETGEPIKVSNHERIVSADQDAFLNSIAQDAFLNSIAQGAGYKSLDAMFADFGMPAGPTIKGGKRAAATGMSPEDDQRTAAAIAAPPTLGSTPFARSEPAGAALSSPSGGIVGDPFGKKSSPLGSGMFQIDSNLALGAAGQTQQPAKPGRDASGIITADSAASAYGNDMQRSGGVFGSIDMKGVNEIMARENAVRQSMIDSQRTDNKPGGGVAILGEVAPGGAQTDRENTEKTQRWALDDMAGRMKSAGTRTERAALGQAMNTMIAGQNQLAAEGIRQQGISNAEMARLGLTARAQDLGLQRAQERNDVIARGQDVRAGTAAERIVSQEGVALARISERANRPASGTQPTLAQQRSNSEIDSARARVAGMDPAEIKRKTANYTATGRENPDFDPTLAKAVTQANRRKIGADDQFDQREQAQQPAGTNDHGYDRADVTQRFRSERAMDRHKLGNDTPNGVEVLDASGKVIGHYR